MLPLQGVPALRYSPHHPRCGLSLTQWMVTQSDSSKVPPLENHRRWLLRGTLSSLAIVFSVQWNTWHPTFRHQRATENFLVKVRFSLILPCLSSIWSIAMDSDSGYQTDGSEGSWQQPFFVARHVARHTSCGTEMFLLTTAWRVILPKLLAVTKHWGAVWQRTRGCGWYCCPGRVLRGRLRYL